MVPTLRVGTHPVTLLVTGQQAPQSKQLAHSTKGCTPTQSVGTIKSAQRREGLPSSSVPESPSVGRVEVLRRGTRGRTPSEERWDRTSHRDGPRSSAGRREPRRRRGRMPGWPSLWLLSLGQTRESNSPCKAKSVVGAEESVAIRLLSACPAPGAISAQSLTWFYKGFS